MPAHNSTCRSGSPPSPKSTLPEIHPPREIGVHGALVPSHFSIKCRPLSARSGCWAGHTCCPLTGHAVAYDHDHHLFGYVPGLLGPHLSSLFTLPTQCSFTARSHVRRIRPHFRTLAAGPADAAAEECQTLRSHILRAEECQALRPLSSATGLGHRRPGRAAPLHNYARCYSSGRLHNGTPYQS